MTVRLASLLDRMAQVLLVGAIVAPLLFALAQVIPSRPNVRWAVSVPWFGGPQTGVPSEDQFDPPWGSSLVLFNDGTAESEDVRIVLGNSPPAGPARPSHVEVRGRAPTEYEVIPTDTGAILDLGPMEPGEGLEVTLYRVTWLDVDVVLEGDEPVAETDRPPPFDPRVRLPRWALVAGLFLLAGLAVQTFALRRRTSGKGVA